MRLQLDIEFMVDMNPLVMYIINDWTINKNAEIDSFIEVMDNIRYQYGYFLHWKHEAAINPLSTCGGGYVKTLAAIRAKKYGHLQSRQYNNVILFKLPRQNMVITSSDYVNSRN